MIDASEVTVRPATRRDAIQVSDLLHRLGLHMPNRNEPEQIYSIWDRNWFNNPFYTHYNQEVHMGWVMEHNQKIVGFFGSIPRIYFVGSKMIPVAIASLWGVEKSYRDFTCLLCDQFFYANPIPTKFVTTAIKPTGRIFERYGGKRVPDSQLQSVYMIPFSLGHLIDFKYNGLFRKYRLLWSLLGAVTYLWKVQYTRISLDVRLKEVNPNALTDNYKQFWDNYILTNKGLFASRESEVIQWYYAGCSSELAKKVFVYVNDNMDIVGYVSLLDRPVSENIALKRYILIDLLANDEKIKKKILKAIVRYSYENKVDVLELPLPGMVHPKLIPSIALKRKAPQFPAYYQTSDEEIDTLLLNYENWQVSPFDGDTCLK